MDLKYAIHNSLLVTADEIQKSIEECREIPGVEIEMASDGWIIADPSDKIPERWTRNKGDYHIETIEQQCIIDEIILEK